MDEAEAMAKSKGLEIEWDLDNPRWGRYLKTRFYTDAYEYCPYTDSNLLFASIADHHSWFDTWPGIMEIPPEERPIKITYGDDTEFTQEELRVFTDAYDRFGLQLPWKVGDVAVLCNWRWSHGRPICNLLPGEYRELGVVLGKGFERVGSKSGKWYDEVASNFEV